MVSKSGAPRFGRAYFPRRPRLPLALTPPLTALWAGRRSAATGAHSQVCRSSDMRHLQLAGKHLVVTPLVGNGRTPGLVYTHVLRVSKTFVARSRPPNPRLTPRAHALPPRPKRVKFIGHPPPPRASLQDAF